MKNLLLLISFLSLIQVQYWDKFLFTIHFQNPMLYGVFSSLKHARHPLLKVIITLMYMVTVQ